MRDLISDLISDLRLAVVKSVNGDLKKNILHSCSSCSYYTAFD